MKTPKDEKLQVLLSFEDHLRLKNIIIEKSRISGKMITTSSYIRQLIQDHIEEQNKNQSLNK